VVETDAVEYAVGAVFENDAGHELFLHEIADFIHVCLLERPLCSGFGEFIPFLGIGE